MLNTIMKIKAETISTILNDPDYDLDQKVVSIVELANNLLYLQHDTSYDQGFNDGFDAGYKRAHNWKLKSYIENF